MFLPSVKKPIFAHRLGHKSGVLMAVRTCNATANPTPSASPWDPFPFTPCRKVVSASKVHFSYDILLIPPQKSPLRRLVRSKATLYLSISSLIEFVPLVMVAKYVTCTTHQPARPASRMIPSILVRR